MMVTNADGRPSQPKKGCPIRVFSWVIWAFVGHEGMKARMASGPICDQISFLAGPDSTLSHPLVFAVGA